MKDMSKFQIGVLIVFGLAIIAGVLIFSAYRSSSGVVANVTVWGDLPADVFNKVYEVTGLKTDKTMTVQYVQKNSPDFYSDYVEAVASGNSPDLLILSQSQISKYKGKIYNIPYANYSQRQFKDNFIQGAEIFLNDEGITGLPFMIDPMVMYWNRTNFTNAGLSQPPKIWQDFPALTQKLTVKDSALNVTKSAVSFGEYRNVNNAKEIISSLIMQSGGSVVDSNGQAFTVPLSSNSSTNPIVDAINYFVQYSNPSKTLYSWNRSLPNSLSEFLSGDLSVYFGFASELQAIIAKNPNLNFDIAYFPQPKGVLSPIMYANLKVMSISRTSKQANLVADFKIADAFSSMAGVAEIVDDTNTPPIRRDLLSSIPSDAVSSIFYNSAIWSRTWLDPDYNQTSNIFQNMIESITSGALDTSSAIGNATNRMNALPK